jgi:hypothetical protein
MILSRLQDFRSIFSRYDRMRVEIVQLSNEPEFEQGTCRVHSGGIRRDDGRMAEEP